MMDDINIAYQPWKTKNDQDRFLNEIKRDMYQEKSVEQMTTVEVFNSLRLADGK